MKLRLTGLLFLFATKVFSQDTIDFQLSAKIEIPDCRTISLNAADRLAAALENNTTELCDPILNSWIKSCGISECTQRIIILNALMNNESCLDAIKTYFQNDFHFVLRCRIVSSREIDFGFRYTGHEPYFGFIPLRHRIDSMVMIKSKELLAYRNLSADEKLICLLFSGNIEQFDVEREKKENQDSYISSLFREQTIEGHEQGIAVTIYSGIYSPIGRTRVFDTSPTFGLTISSPIRNRLIVELGMKIRFNRNDKDFRYYAMGDTNTVHADTGLFFGALAGYKIYEDKTLIVLPKLGIGLESVDTGLSKPGTTGDDKEYFSVETVHLSLGISVMRSVFVKRHVGFEFSYHYCPYQLDTSLETKFNNSSVSGELFFRF